MDRHLERLARRVGEDEFFLAAPLARVADSQQLDDAALAVRLGCDVETLTHLRLCRNPDPQPPHFWQDVERIAGRFQLDADRLAEVVRLGQALLQAKAQVAKDAPGFLMAAREDEEAERQESEGGQP